MGTKLRIVAAFGVFVSFVAVKAEPAAPPWSQIRSVQMQGPWKAFWNVGGGDVKLNNREATAHGFRLVNLLGT